MGNSNIFTHFSPMSHFYTSWIFQCPFVFLLESWNWKEWEEIPNKKLQNVGLKIHSFINNQDFNIASKLFNKLTKIALKNYVLVLSFPSLISDIFIKVQYLCLYNTRFFNKKRFFSIQPQYYLTFSWPELQMLLTCCLIHIIIIILRHILYLVYLCPV